MYTIRKILTLLLIVTVWSCSGGERETTTESSGDFEREFRARLLNAQEGDILLIPEGRFSFKKTLILNDVPYVTIRGAGMDKSFLSFKGQKGGDPGLNLKGTGILLEDFTVEDSRGDAIRVSQSQDVTFRRVNATWTDGAKKTNGGYGLYPVECLDVLIEYCEASYASDAGICAGQSVNVLMRNNSTHHNVVGMEIQNSLVVESFDNLAENNTCGILVSNKPGLRLANNHTVRVHDNVVRDNNFGNFAPKERIANIIPSGTGILLLACQNVAVYHNAIEGYKTMGLGMISYDYTQLPYNRDNDYSPYCVVIDVYENNFKRKEGSKYSPDISREIGSMINAVFSGKAQDIIMDGILDPHVDQNNGNYSGLYSLCVRENGDDLRFANLNARGIKGVAGLKKSFNRDLSMFNCQLMPMDVLGALKLLPAEDQ